MAKLNLSPPWDIFYREMSVLFKHDNDIRIVFDDTENNLRLKLYVNNPDKAFALDCLLPKYKEFGSNTVDIIVVSPNVNVTFVNTDDIKEDDIYDKTTSELFDIAFNGNDIYKYSMSVDYLFTNPITYVVFKKEVVQYFTDNLVICMVWNQHYIKILQRKYLI